MNNEEYMKWLDGLKKGDTFYQAITGHENRYAAIVKHTVLRRTKTQIVCIDGKGKESRYQASNGKRHGDSGRHWSQTHDNRLAMSSEYELQQARVQILHIRSANKLSALNWLDLSPEAVAEIVSIVKADRERAKNGAGRFERDPNTLDMFAD